MMSTNSTERKIAKKAKDMLQDSFDQKFKGFKNHFQGKATADNKYKPLSESKIKYRGKNWTSPEGVKVYYLNKLVLDMAPHGFVQHYGVDNRVRRAHVVERKKPRPSSFVRHAHNWDLPATEFIDSALRDSDVVPFIEKEISEHRGYRVLQAYIDKMAVNINQNQPKK